MEWELAETLPMCFPLQCFLFSLRQSVFAADWEKWREVRPVCCFVWPSGSVQFKVEPDTVRGGLFSKPFYCVAASDLRGEGDEDRRQACPFCLVLNALIDKQGFSLSVRMKHKQALQPTAGVVGE